MKKYLAILGSTGSIGTSSLNVISKNKNYKVKLLTTNKNIKKIFKQAKIFNVKDVIVEDEIKYKKYKLIFKKNSINLHHGLNNINKIIKNKLSYCINSIIGIDGLKPTLDIMPHTENILIANKESIICGWELIKEKLKKNKTNFIPLDSEHFSIWNLIKNDKTENISKIILTASGGPFLNLAQKKIANIKPELAVSHPNWKMGKKISIDSSTMMNKIYEYIEAIKIFELKKKQLSILIHPSSYVHAIVFYKNNIVKLLAHDTKMSIPISAALDISENTNKKIFELNFNKLNNINFEKAKKKQFPLLSIVEMIPNKASFFEIILVSLNDNLVNKYLKKEINYISIQKNLLKLIKRPFFRKFYKLKPKNIYDIKKMQDISKNYLEKNLKNYEK